jgi:16S rRNA (adenine(1408)-N(1))-methyltransferase
MAESSLRAARTARKGGLPNALFVVAAAERPPGELLGIADELTIAFPWGSLLRGVLALDEAADAAAGIAALLAPGGRAIAHLSIDPRDRLAMPALETSTSTQLAGRWRCHDHELCAWRPATPAEVGATRSSWARRLHAAGGDRVTWRLELCRDDGRRTTVAGNPALCMGR